MNSLRWYSAASVALFAVTLTVVSFVLPQRVPVHWAGDGAPDSFGSAGQLVLVFAVVGAGLAALFGGILLLVRRGSLASVNVPYPSYWKTPQHEAELRRRLGPDLNRFMTAVFLFLSTAVVGIVASADAPGQRLSPVLVADLTIFLSVVVGYVVYMYAYRYRPPS